jgi:protein arginine kinase
MDSIQPVTYMHLPDLSELEREILFERHLIEKDAIGNPNDKGLAFRDDERVAIQTNEEDHIRISGFASGFDLWEALRLAREVDGELEVLSEIAYSDKWGYLTACPTNVGTGMRSSLLVHLPGLVLTREIGKVVNGISQIGLAVRGFRGEGSEVVGNLFQVSNQSTLGQTEEEIVEMVHKVVAQLLQYEDRAREVLLTDARLQVEDKVWRALGLLRSARLMSSHEGAALCSAVRLGVDLGILKGLEMPLINELFLLSQPAHIRKREGEEITPEERDSRRADYVRRRVLVE